MADDNNAEIPPKDPEGNGIKPTLDKEAAKVTTTGTNWFTNLMDKVSWVLIGIALIVWFICKSIAGDDSIITLLSDPANARGLLTYVIVLAVVGMAFTLCYQAFIPGGDKEQFGRAREVFASLTGVLGTIVGFHFGISDKGSPELEVRSKLVDSQMTVVVSGGKLPYTYALKSEPAGIIEAKASMKSEDGWFQVPVKPAATDGQITLELRDSAGHVNLQTIEVKGKKQ